MPNKTFLALCGHPLRKMMSHDSGGFAARQKTNHATPFHLAGAGFDPFGIPEQSTPNQMDVCFPCKGVVPFLSHPRAQDISRTDRTPQAI